MSASIATDSPAASSAKESKTHSRTPIVYTVDEIEAAAASNNSLAATAKALGHRNAWNFKGKLERHPEMKAAYERGVARRKAGRSIRDNAATAEQIEARHERELAEVALAVDAQRTDPTQEDHQPQHPLTAAEGQAHFFTSPEHETSDGEPATVMTNPKVIDELVRESVTPNDDIEYSSPRNDPFSEPATVQPATSSPTSIPKETGDTQSKRAGIEDLNRSVSFQCVSLRKGSRPMIGFEGNYFDLTKSERQFLDEVTDRFNNFGRVNPRKRTPLQVIADWLATL